MLNATWRLLRNGPAPGAWNMALDEAILEHVQQGTSAPTLRLYAWAPPCLSLGLAQPYADVDEERLHALGWDVVRRLTGGRAILHTDELTYSAIGPSTEPRLAGSVLESYSRLADALAAGLRALGLAIEMSEHKAPAESRANPVCFEVPSPYEITVDGRKLVGSAQARRRQNLLQHGSVPLRGDLTRICQALVFADEETRRAAAARLLRSAITVEQALGRAVTFEAAAEALRQGFESKLHLKFEPAEPSASELRRANELVTQKYGNSSWTRRV